MKKWNIVLLLLFLSFNLCAQKLEASFQIGTGALGMYSHITRLKPLSFIQDSYIKNFQTGITCHFFPNTSPISINSGLIYKQIFFISSTKIIVFQLPLGLDLIWNKEKNISSGAGVYYNLLNGDKYPDRTYPNHQLGLSVNFGLAIPTNKILSFELKFQYQYDLTKLYTDTSNSLVSGILYTNFYSSSLTFIIALRFQLNS